MGILLPSNNILLIGFMGCGKSTVGRELAKTLDFQFLDTDALIEASQGRSISDIFKVDGEAYFRALEKDLLSWIANHVSHAVISTGGGLPILSKDLNRAGDVFYLKLDFELILKRILENEKAKRPLFQDEKSAYELYVKREPIYEERAQYTISANDEVKNIVERILEKYHT